MTMLVANGNQLVSRGDENDWYLKVLINNSDEFIRVELWTRMSTKLGSEFEPGDETM